MKRVNCVGFTLVAPLCRLAFDSQDEVEGHDGMAAGD